MTLQRLAMAVLLALSTATPYANNLYADDWPHWLGPDRDATYHESGLAERIPEEGLPVKWRAPVAYGYAGPAVANGKVYLFEYEATGGKPADLPSRRDELEGMERLRCLDAASGDELWRQEYNCPYNVSYGGGPRCTPTVDGDRVYTLGTMGDLKCRSVKDGSLIWEKNFQRDYDAETPVWGHSAHPLVAGGLVYCLVGGQGALAVAFDKLTGEERWKNLSDNEPGYCPPVIINAGDAEQLLIWSPSNLHSLRPESGELLWKLPVNPAYGMSITRPQKMGDKIYVSAIGGVSVLMQLNAEGSDVEGIWSGGASDSLQSANVTPIFTKDAIYGCDCQTSDLVAINPADGSRLWATKAPTIGVGERGRHGTAFLVRRGDSDDYFLFNEGGDLITARLTPEGYEETGRMHVLEPTSSTFGRPVVWSCPAFAEKCAFMRNDKELVCVSLEE